MRQIFTVAVFLLLVFTVAEQAFASTNITINNYGGTINVITSETKSSAVDNPTVPKDVVDTELEYSAIREETTEENNLASDTENFTDLSMAVRVTLAIAAACVITLAVMVYLDGDKIMRQLKEAVDELESELENDEAQDNLVYNNEPNNDSQNEE